MAGSNRRHDWVYQLVTDDATEMVLVQTDTLQEMAEETGYKRDTLSSALARKCRVKYKGVRVHIIRVELDDEDDEEEGL